MIVDAPATGHGVGFLQTPRTFANIARVGPIRQQAETLDAFIRDRKRTGVAVVALPEEMPVNETAMLERDLASEVGVARRPDLLQRALPGALRRARDGADRGDGRAAPTGTARSACRSALTQSRRARAQREQLARLEENCEAPVTTLPYLFSDDLGVDGVDALADAHRGLMPGVADLLEGKRICVCAGSGGVGKTTTSAAIAAGMAARGKRVAVLTIDPARRLADSLGLPELGNVERQVDPALFAGAGVDPGEGELWAMMLDSKQTFDEVIREHAPDAETRDRILSNRIYQQLSDALAGSQEYMAMEKLYEIHAEDRYDLLVLDTPPSRNALDFLEAPNRLTPVHRRPRAAGVHARRPGSG